MWRVHLSDSSLNLKNNRKRLQFYVQLCSKCIEHRGEPEVNSKIQLKFVDRCLKRKRNHIKWAITSWPRCSRKCATISTVSNSRKFGKPYLTNDTNNVQMHQQTNPSNTPSIFEATVSSSASNTLNELNNSITSNEPDKTEELQRVYANIKIACLSPKLSKSDLSR